MIACMGSCDGMMKPLGGIKRSLPQQEVLEDVEFPETKYSKEEEIILPIEASPTSHIETVHTDLRKLIIQALSYADDKDQAQQLVKAFEGMQLPLQAIGQDKLTLMYNAVENIRNILMSNKSFKSILNDQKFAGALIDSLAVTYELPLVDVAIALGTDAAARWIAQKYDENNEIKRTALLRFWTASAQGDMSILRFLLQYASEKNRSDLINAQLSKTSALQIAIKKVKPAVIDYLLAQKNIDLETKDINSVTPLFEAVTHGDSDLVEKLLARGANINQKSRHGETALLHAVHNNRMPIVKRLLELKADVNIQNDHGSTALMIASWKNNDILVQELIRAGADLNIQNVDGNNALILAVNENAEAIAIVKKLIEAGADLNIENNDGAFALDIALAGNYDSIVKALLDTNKIKQEHKDLILSAAAATGNVNIAKLLLEFGADVNNQNYDNHTPLWHARNNDNPEKDEIIKILIERGAQEYL